MGLERHESKQLSIWENSPFKIMCYWSIAIGNKIANKKSFNLAKVCCQQPL